MDNFAIECFLAVAETLSFTIQFLSYVTFTFSLSELKSIFTVILPLYFYVIFKYIQSRILIKSKKKAGDGI